MVGDPSSWHFVSFFALKPEAQAAWAQAWLTIATFAGTVIFGLRQRALEHRRLKRAENSHARDLAMRVIGAVDGWSDRYTPLLQRTLKGQNALALVVFRESGARPIPQALVGLAGSVHLLADAAPPIQFAVYWSSLLEARMNDFVWYENYASTHGVAPMSDDDHTRARALEKDLGDQIRRIAVAVSLAKAQLHKLFD